MDLSFALEMVGRTDPGLVRSHNEDSIFYDPGLGVVVLADGMGGYNAGEVASGMATALMRTGLEAAFANSPSYRLDATGRPLARTALENEIIRANGAILQAAHSQPQYAGMGTTLVSAVFYDNSMVVAHVGDSRLYRLRNGEFVQLTRDHSLLQEQIDSGMITKAEARRSQNRNLVTRALGVEPVVEPEVHEYDTVPGDIYLFCSDGLNDMIEDDDIAQAVKTSPDDLELTATELVQMANHAGGRDNVSVILVKIRGEYPAPRGWLPRLFSWMK